VGINLNTNNTCNWSCIYCQVENLQRGVPPAPNLERLRSELHNLLTEALQGDFLLRYAPPDARRVMDVAFSGNGEPTISPLFTEALIEVRQVIDECCTQGGQPSLPLRLITNGSMLLRQNVRRAVGLLGKTVDGEVWFKLDRATITGMELVNGNHQLTASVVKRLRCCAQLAPTWLQTCWFAEHGKAPDKSERETWLQVVGSVASSLQGVHLYGLARPSMQSQAATLSPLPLTELEDFAVEIRQRTGLLVNVVQ